ncbi:uncharacterized protein LOC114861136 [Betta splendens]|uniref:Uncharacterized protein LOC114861136 n=1 Tax=Betta splendens TaxID=158456 RepID=A0A6P7N979_BETSP|nr:uncharacterized protein LOC114861136 [Betta splendens]XP_055366923.1 uncharacterized protein LOC114861136 [Betta splendens]XP_055366924.1 uncharacterized protein LOC114861136 [Betta splendens]XP_055366925.1 uncharacterized protein LOC114861136 [Betta splendens]
MMTGRLTVCCVALFLTLSSATFVKRLHSINDLKKINFGQSVPKHSLLLLHWFANTVDVDNNDVIWLTFDPDNKDYGSHHYGNFERLLDQLPQGQRYFTVGNLNGGASLPSYVYNPPREYREGNRDRVIFSVSGQRIGQVYITQHYGTSENQGTRYDPEHTYQVTTNLLRQIREFAVGQNQGNLLSELREDFGSNADDSQLREIKITWGDLAPLGLLLFIVIQEKYSFYKKRPQTAPRRKAQPDFVVNIPENGHNHMDAVETLAILMEDQNENIRLKVMTNTNGKARIVWENIPIDLLREGVMVMLFDNNEGQEAKTYKYIGNRASGSYDTSVPLNDGLQARLHKVRTRCCFWRGVGLEIRRGTEFKNPEAVKINGFNAKLQLFAKDGKACVRLYVNTSFREWKSEFKKAWVGFYTSENKATNEYEWWKWQWATKFKPNYDYEQPLYEIYEYHSGMAIAPGVQARFILRDREVKACTPSWK